MASIGNQSNFIAYSLLKGKDNLGSKGQLGGEKVKSNKTNLNDGLSYNEMEMLDTNKDGVLSKEEFLEGTKKDKKAQEKWDNYFKEWKSYKIDIGNGKKIKGREVKSTLSDGDTTSILSYKNKEGKNILLNTENKGEEVNTSSDSTVKTSEESSTTVATDSTAELKQAGKTSKSKDIIDGIIGKFKQGGTSDCWLLSGLYALSQTETGKQIIKDSIKQNDDGSITVTFKGVGASYTVTKEELAEFDTDNNKNDEYSNGDNDVLAIELAVDKLHSDIYNHPNSFEIPKDIQKNARGDIKYGGEETDLLYYFTGNEGNVYNKPDGSDAFNYNGIKNLFKKLKSNINKTPVTFAISDKCNVKYKDPITHKEGKFKYSGGNHALAIKNIDNKKEIVTFINPWDSGKEYTMTFKDFAKIGVYQVSNTDISEPEYKNYVEDRTKYGNEEHTLGISLFQSIDKNYKDDIYLADDTKFKYNSKYNKKTKTQVEKIKKYDKSERLTEEYKRVMSNKKIYTDETQYNKGIRTSRTVNYLKGGGDVAKIEYQYDKNGKVKSKLITYKDGSVKNKEY